MFIQEQKKTFALITVWIKYSYKLQKFEKSDYDLT